MKGKLYSDNKFYYPQFKVKLCNPAVPEIIQCATIEEIYNITSGGRLFLFLKDE